MAISDVMGGAAASSPDPEELSHVWSRLQEALQSEIRREQFETWFRRTTLVHADLGTLRIAVHNAFTLDWLNRYYLKPLERAAQAVFGSPRTIEFEVDPEKAAAAPPPRVAPGDPSSTSEEEPIEELTPQPPPSTLPLADTGDCYGLLESSDVTLNKSYLFDNFVVGPCNRFAHAACVGVSESPGRIYNPLFLHGSVGLGKTHLLQSLCHSILQRTPRARILYLSCETFVNHFISSLENGDLETFRNKYRNVDLLVVDDIHVLANKERTQEEFFHTFNTLYNAGRQIVLSSDSPPVEIPTLQERLVSRFKWGLVTEIETPCYETRMAILKRKSRERGREIPDEVAELLAERIDSNIRELEGAVNKVLGYAALTGVAVTCDLVRQCLRDVFHQTKGLPSIEDILKVVTDHFGVKLSDLQSKKRTNAIAFPRQVGMYLARTITRMSLEEIGGYFGGRDHSTVLYAVQKMKRLAAEDPDCQELLTSLTAEIKSGSPT